MTNKSIQKNLEAGNLKKALEVDAKIQEERLKKEELDKKKLLSKVDHSIQVGYKKSLQDSREQQENLGKIIRFRRERRNMHPQTTLAMELMEAAERFEALAKYVGSVADTKREEYEKYYAEYGKAAANAVGEGGKATAKYLGLWGEPAYTSRIYDWLESKVTGKEKKIDIPDLKYFTSLNKDGVLEQAWVTDYLPRLFSTGQKDKDGQIIQDQILVDSFQKELQNAVTEWIETVQDDHGQGFFISKDNRIFSKGHTTLVRGGFMLDPAIVADRYEATDYEIINPATGEIQPKIGAQPKPGKEPLYLTVDQFEALRDNKAHPEKSLDRFLVDRYDHELDISQSIRP